MALDDQLAALAAGELDDDAARALRARAAADPAIAQQLRRHEELHRRLRDWEAPPMSAAAVQRLDARIDEALAALDDGPLAQPREVARAPAETAPAADERTAAGTGGAVVDLGRARQRRAGSRTTGGGAIAWPSWGAPAAVAAALFAVVGVGIVLAGFPDNGGLDVLAGGGDEAAEDSAEMAEDTAGTAADEQAATGMAEESMEADEEAEAPTAESFDSGESASTDAPTFGTARRRDVVVEEGELLALLDPAGDAAADGDTTEESDDSADEERSTSAAEQCVDEALERDTAQAEDREVTLLGEGTYAGQPAAFVVVRTPEPGDDRYEVLAYEPDDCSLLARDETRR